MADPLRTDVLTAMRTMTRFVGAPQHREHWSLQTEAIKTSTSMVATFCSKSFFEFLGDEPKFR
ncbi:hypothetical protein [Mycobacterium uberis]|uniref:hypothetical protein n=1 Tax=Mycobacterium uberis TaxID=2162698 RepID=UPI000E3072FA|nr:hypothetical protein [Mycobacterium uberis]